MSPPLLPRLLLSQVFHGCWLLPPRFRVLITLEEISVPAGAAQFLYTSGRSRLPAILSMLHRSPSTGRFQANSSSQFLDWCLYLFMDSSLEGWGATLSQRHMYVLDVWRSLHINLVELYFSFVTTPLHYPTNLRGKVGTRSWDHCHLS